MNRKWRIPNSPQIGYLHWAAIHGEPKFYVLIGCGTGDEVVAMADGLRNWDCHYPHGESPVGRLLVLHWDAGVKDVVNLLSWIDDGRYRRVAPQGEWRPKFMLRDIVRFVSAGDDYSGWRAEIERLVGQGVVAGIICHLGGKDDPILRQQLTMCLPLLDARTRIVLANTTLPCVRREYYRMTQEKGWSGIIEDTFAVLLSSARRLEDKE